MWRITNIKNASKLLELRSNIVIPYKLGVNTKITFINTKTTRTLKIITNATAKTIEGVIIDTIEGTVDGTN